MLHYTFWLDLYMRKGNSIEENTVYLVSWKSQDGHVELFYDLEVFFASYPRYSQPEVSKALTSGVAAFEDDELRIEKKAIIIVPKPDFPPMFFWDLKYDKIDWVASFATVIQRILERGMPEHWQELKRFYGYETIIIALKEIITYPPDTCIDEASSFFKLKKEEMLCFKRKQSQPKLWL